MMLVYKCISWRVAVVLLLALGRVGFAEVWWPEAAYPLPDKASAPGWLTGEKLNFSRWDGGRIEVSKAFLSGWPYFNPPWPDVVDATTRWTDIETVQLAREMGYNFLWLTFSAGFSIEQERGQWEALRAYVEECHKYGIKVAAYMSSCNVFVDDMFAQVPECKEWLLLDADGVPVPYGAANFKKIGRITRQLADITNPDWKNYLKKRIDAAIDLGFDALEYDNTHWAVAGEKSKEQYATFLARNGFADTPETRHVYEREAIKRLFPELLGYAKKRKPDMVLFCNINRPLYAIQRGCTVIATEDGLEPGYYAYKSQHEIGADDRLAPLYEDRFLDIEAEPFDSQKLIANLGRLRLLHGLNEGWKPVLVEFGGRQNGHRQLNQFPPLAFQLAIAECNAALCSLQGYQEGLALLELYRRKPEVMRSVEAAHAAHRFVSKYQEYVVGACYKADVAFVMDERLDGIEFLGQLDRQNVQYDVVYEDRLKEDFLRGFQCVVAYGAKLISDDAVTTLVRYAQNGGRLMLFGETGAMTNWGQPRANNPLAADGPWKREDTEKEAVVKFIQENTKPLFSVLDCPYVLFTITQAVGTSEGGFVVHLLNYQKEPLSNVRVRCASAAIPKMVALTLGCGTIEKAGGEGEWVIPKLGVYSMLIFGP